MTLYSEEVSLKKSCEGFFFKGANRGNACLIIYFEEKSSIFLN